MSQAWQQLTSNLWSVQSEAFIVHSGVILDSSEVCLIDPGLFPHEIEGIAAFAAERGMSANTMILTHCHWDHVLGPERLPQFPKIAHVEYSRQATGRQGRRVMKQAKDWETDQRIARSTPFVVPLPDVTFEETMPWSVGELALQLIHAPGHAPDHLAIYEPKSRMLWSADMLSDLEIPYVCHSLLAYQNTLELLSQLDIQVLVPAHGTPASVRADIAARFNMDAAYVEELRSSVTRAIHHGKDIAETVADCANMPYRHRQNNERPHRMNVESAYLELGGEADSPRIGWQGLVEGID